MIAFFFGKLSLNIGLPLVVGHPLYVKGFLQGYGNAVQRTPYLAFGQGFISGLCPLTRGLDVQADDRVDFGVILFQAAQIDIEHFPAAHLFAADQGCYFFWLSEMEWVTKLPPKSKNVGLTRDRRLIINYGDWS